MLTLPLTKTTTHAHAQHIQVVVSFLASAADSNFWIRTHCVRIERERLFIAERSLGTLFMSSIWSETIFKPRSIIRTLLRTSGGGGGVGVLAWWWAFSVLFRFHSRFYWWADINTMNAPRLHAIWLLLRNRPFFNVSIVLHRMEALKLCRVPDGLH